MARRPVLDVRLDRQRGSRLRLLREPRLADANLITGETTIDLTTEGHDVHRSLREYITGPTARLLGRFDIHDIETTVQTLQAITAYVTEEYSSEGA